eukprot:218638-Rhodomonas_salina.1
MRVLRGPSPELTEHAPVPKWTEQDIHAAVASNVATFYTAGSTALARYLTFVLTTDIPVTYGCTGGTMP